MGLDNKVFTFDEVSVHNSAKDCWVIINAKAYDVTSFLSDHPGGDDVLLGAAGKDASGEFEDVGHGSAARLMLDEYYVGEVEVEASSSSTEKTLHKLLQEEDPPKLSLDTNYKDKSSSDFTLKILIWILGSLAILGLSVALHLYR